MHFVDFCDFLCWGTGEGTKCIPSNWFFYFRVFVFIFVNFVWWGIVEKVDELSWAKQSFGNGVGREEDELNQAKQSLAIPFPLSLLDILHSNTTISTPLFTFSTGFSFNLTTKFPPLKKTKPFPAVFSQKFIRVYKETARRLEKKISLQTLTTYVCSYSGTKLSHQSLFF